MLDSFQTPTSNLIHFDSNNLMYRTNVRGSDQISLG